MQNLIRPKPQREDPRYAVNRRRIDLSSTTCECFFCEYEQWCYETPGLHRQYQSTHYIPCVIARSNTGIIDCDALIDEAMNDETVFDCILICDLLDTKEYYFRDLNEVKQVHLGRNWERRKDIVSLYDSHLRSQCAEDHIEKYLLSEYVLREICSYDPSTDIRPFDPSTDR